MSLKSPVWSVIALVLTPALASGGERCADAAASVESVEGLVQVQPKGQSAWQGVRLGEHLCAGDSVRVGANSRAAVRLSDEQTVLRFDQNTNLTLSEHSTDSGSWLDLLTGAVHFLSRTPQPLQIRTPYVNAAVEGTEFLLRVEPQRTGLWVYEGRMRVSNAQGNLLVEGGEIALTQQGQAPRKYLLAQPVDAVQWALHYPPLLDNRHVAQSLQLNATEREALVHYRHGVTHQALIVLERVPVEQRDYHYHVLRAGLLLSVGRVEQAEAELALLPPHDGHVLAQQAVIALAQNQTQHARTLAEQAVQNNPELAVAWSALSYVQQGQFELQPALRSAERALQLDDQDALAWARLAELRLSIGDLDQALTAAKRAVALNPDISRTQAVLGFVYLARLELKRAREAFGEARSLDQGDPLPVLGMSLIDIRQGKLAQGRQQLETATTLDPGNAIMRSYLGKAYVDEQRDKRAATQFELAKQRDANDPTPWFYNALRLQDAGQPVAALRELQSSIERNDNRAVYRSKLLLDQDEAARNASQSRVYRELGLESAAQVDAWQGAMLDPSDHSTHRLLADLYAKQPRHNVARVSELLQSQLLQPLGLTPLQPQLAESNLGILSGAGPSELAFSDYNTLFVREGAVGQLNAVVGANNTWGNDAVAAGLSGDWAWSIGQFHYQTDGHRDNADQRLDSYNAFVQWMPSYDTSVQLELRHSQRDEGDVGQVYDPTYFSEFYRKTKESDYLRLGLRQRLGVDADLLVHAATEYSAEELSDVLTNGMSYEANGQNHRRTLEMQYLQRDQDWSSTSGFAWVEGKSRDDFSFVFPTGDVFAAPGNELELKQYSFYSYFNYRPISALQFTLGLNWSDYDRYHAVQQLNPKLGLLWYIQPELLLRAAIFRTTELARVGDQTLEPTQIAGFNQLYDEEGEGSDVWSYGLGLDWQIKDNWFTGAEVLYRDARRPTAAVGVSSDTDNATSEVLIKDVAAKGYLDWLANSQLALGTEYRYERYEVDELGLSDGQPTQLDTHTAKLRGRWFIDSASRAELVASHVTQDTEYPAEQSARSGSEKFWNLDAALRYRLPGQRAEFSVEARNLLDESFVYYERDRSDPDFYPEQVWLARFSWSF